MRIVQVFAVHCWSRYIPLS